MIAYIFVLVCAGVGFTEPDDLTAAACFLVAFVVLLLQKRAEGVEAVAQEPQEPGQEGL